MGVRGPSPTPTAILKARGSWRAKGRDGEPAPAVDKPACPAWLSKEGKAAWRKIVPELIRLAVLAKIDGTALTTLCQSWAEYIDATLLLDKEGRIITADVFNRNGDKTGTVKKLHPAVKLQKEAYTRLKSIMVEFGLTPSSRTRLRTPEKPAAQTDKSKDRFFRTA